MRVSLTKRLNIVLVELKRLTLIILSYLDTAWFLANVDSVNKKIRNVKNGEYEANSVNTVDTCLSKGDYNLTVYDEFGEIV